MQQIVVAAVGVKEPELVTAEAVQLPGVGVAAGVASRACAPAGALTHAPLSDSAVAPVVQAESL